MTLLLWACPSGARRAQDDEDGDEIPDEEEAGVGAAGAAKVLVAVPTDFTLSESCQELMDALCGVRARPPGPPVQLLQQGDPCTYRPRMGCAPNTQLIMQVSRTSTAAARCAAAGCARRDRAAPAVLVPLRMSGCGTLGAAERPQLHARRPRA